MEHHLQYFYDWHDITCNQKYDHYLPYSFHLKAVDAAILFFKDCLPELEDPDVFLNDSSLTIARIVGAGHDVIEDARLTYNDIVKRHGVMIADGIFACTESTGRNRKERKDKAYYDRLFSSKIGVFVKLCDIIANTNYSILTFNKSMLKDKRTDFATFIHEADERLFNLLPYEPILKHLDHLYASKI